MASKVRRLRILLWSKTTPRSLTLEDVDACVSPTSFAHIDCYSDRSHRGASWLNPFATVLFNLEKVTYSVECCVLYLCCVGVFGMYAVM